MADIPKFAGFKAEQRHLDKLRSLASITGLTTGDVLRALVESAGIEAVTTLRPVATGFTNDKSASVKVCETTTSAFAE